uniref:Reverse transcriptase zinc-binding domain-containing protein n=1 Tax=Setaria viridis TaxID=4556 RepID=A0A4U6UF85_SETVI|nr:hypothetical protein SEVIR_5G055300v2 [Setaria viridis]
MTIDDYSCIFCNNVDDETIEHLFFIIAKPFFMEIIILMSWSIWIVKNNFIFTQQQLSTTAALTNFKHEFAMVIRRAKSKYFPSILEWQDLYL